jgi:predicted small integral membrane protein
VRLLYHLLETNGGLKALDILPDRMMMPAAPDVADVHVRGQTKFRDHMIAVRVLKIVLVLAVASFCLLVGYNNIVDYGSNFMFVQHVLSMDTTFPGNAVRAGRAIVDPELHRLAYAIIIGAELIVGVLCLAGAIRLAAAANASAAAFNAAKTLALVGLGCGMAFWFTAFLVVGGEWFQMWQSEIWNGQDAAFRFLASIGIMLIFVAMDDR